MWPRCSVASRLPHFGHMLGRSVIYTISLYECILANHTDMAERNVETAEPRPTQQKQKHRIQRMPLPFVTVVFFVGELPFVVANVALPRGITLPVQTRPRSLFLAFGTESNHVVVFVFRAVKKRLIEAWWVVAHWAPTSRGLLTSSAEHRQGNFPMAAVSFAMPSRASAHRDM